MLVFASLLACGQVAEVDDGGGGAAEGGDQAGATGNASSGKSASASTGDPNNLPCSKLAPLATESDLALTPREDVDAEILAVEGSGSFVASDLVYARVREELAVIRTLEPGLAHLVPHSEIRSGRIALSVDETTDAALRAGSDTELSCVAAFYGAVLQPSPQLAGYVTVKISPKIVDTPALAAQLARVAGVTYASPEPLTDGPDVCLHRAGEMHVYVFDDAGGDCPAGCTEHVYTGYSVAPDGTPKKLGSFDPYLDAEPSWFSAAQSCADRL